MACNAPVVRFLRHGALTPRPLPIYGALRSSRSRWPRAKAGFAGCRMRIVRSRRGAHARHEPISDYMTTYRLTMWHLRLWTRIPLPFLALPSKMANENSDAVLVDSSTTYRYGAQGLGTGRHPRDVELPCDLVIWLAPASIQDRTNERYRCSALIRCACEFENKKQGNRSQERRGKTTSLTPELER